MAFSPSENNPVPSTSAPRNQPARETRQGDLALSRGRRGRRECRGVVGGTARRVRFAVHVRDDNRERTPPLVRLQALCGPGDDGEPVIIVMSPGED
jgi:hypothetical protein